MEKRVYYSHNDMDSFYVSAETMLDLQFKVKAVAVCSATEELHGIVLAKSDLSNKRMSMQAW